MAGYLDERLAEGLAPATVRRELALISHVFTIARKEWRMESLSNPVELIHQPSVDDARNRRILSANVWTLQNDELVCEHLDELGSPATQARPNCHRLLDSQLKQACAAARSLACFALT